MPRRQDMNCRRRATCRSSVAPAALRKAHCKNEYPNSSAIQGLP